MSPKQAPRRDYFPQLSGLIILSSLILCLLRFNTIPVGSFFDDAHYLVLAESLANGHGYHLVNYPHAPVERAFPPGWPVLLTPLAALFPGNLFFPKLLTLLLTLGTFLLVYTLLAPRLARPYQTGLLILVALNPHLVGMSGTVMSEAAFIFFVLLSLNVLAAWGQPQNGQKWWLLGIAFVLALVAALIRTIGIALILGMGVYVVGRIGRFRWLAGITAVCLTLGTGLIWLNAQQGGSLLFSSQYSTHLTYITSRLGDFLRFWQQWHTISPETITNGIIPIFELQPITNLLTPIGTLLLSLIILAVAAIGFFHCLPHKQPTELYVLAYGSIFYFWVVYIDTTQPRLVIPLIPFLYFYWLQATIWFAGRISPPHAGRVVWLVVGLISLLSLARNAHAWLNPVQDRVVDLTAGTTWLRENAPPDAVIMTPNPVPDYLYIRRLTVDYPRKEEDVLTYLQQNEVQYLIVRPNLRNWDSKLLDPIAQEILIPFINAETEKFQVVYSNQDEAVTVYQVVEQTQ